MAACGAGWVGLSGMAAFVLTFEAAAAAPTSPPAPAVVEVCVGDAHSCARAADGAVACWGDNGHGQAATDVGVLELDAPRWVTTLPRATRLQCGPRSTCVLDGAGQIQCIGFRYDARTRVPHATDGGSGAVVRIGLPGPARDLALAEHGGCAILRDGRVACWHEESPTAPFLIDGLGGVGAAMDDGAPLAFAIASAHPQTLCATRARAAPACIRFGGRGPHDPDKGFPYEVKVRPELAGARALLTLEQPFPRVCAVGLPDQAHGSVKCISPDGRTGFDPSSELTAPVTAPLGTNGTVACFSGAAGIRCVGAEAGASPPVPPDATAIALGTRHGCAIAAGRVSCWGAADQGQLGDGTPYLHGPQPVPGVDDAVELVAARGIVCASRKTGQLSCWGRSESWQPAPGPVELPAPPSGTVARVTALAIDRHGWPCARPKQGGRWSCWNGAGWVTRARNDSAASSEMTGESAFSRLGIAMRTLAPDGACGIDQRGRLACVDCPGSHCTRAGVVFAPGTDFVEATSIVGPVRVATGTAPSDVERMVCARSKDARVRCFDVNDKGLAPLSIQGVDGLTNVLRVTASRGEANLAAARSYASLVCTIVHRPSDAPGSGAVSCWGDAERGQLGSARGNSAGQVIAAVPIDGVPAANDVVVGGTFACVRLPDGKVQCWGSNRDGRAPNGAPGSSPKPIPVAWPPLR